VSKVRESGYALADEDVTIGIGACGTPIFDRQENIVGALAISGIRQNILGDPLPEIIELMKRSAQEVSVGLGYGTKAEPVGRTSNGSRRVPDVTEIPG
jgi:DNA-binding IclR family transcriptional regulator